jgi:Tol biopolymer transport system component
MDRIGMTPSVGYTPQVSVKPKITGSGETAANASLPLSAEKSDTAEISGLPPLETPKDAVKTLASGFGYAEFPQVSPDGKKLVFNVVYDYTTSQMFIMDSDGGKVKSLFTNETVTPESFGSFMENHKGKTDEQGTWSHDGKSIFYRTNEKGTFGIAKFDVKHGESELLVHDSNMNLKHPEETEDGYIVGYGGKPGQKFKTSEEFSDIFIADPEKGSYKLITHSDGSVAYKHPSIMDGKILAHKEPKNTENVLSDIILIDPKTGKEKNLTNTPNADERHPFYNENVDLLAFHSDESADKNIWLATPDGKKKCQLTFYGKAAQSPCWSPDGSKIYFVRKQDKQAEGEPFYSRQADIRVIDVKDALKDLKKQAKSQLRELEDCHADKKLIRQAEENLETYKDFLKKFD